MSRHHLMITYWRDSSQPSDARILTVAGDDAEDVLGRSNERARTWMRDGAIEPQDEPDEPEAEEMGLWS